MLGTIELKGMSFHAFHGCLEEEKRLGNEFVVDVEFRYDFSKAASGDDLSCAVDYSLVYEIVRQQMERPSNLLENVVWRIREAIAAEFPDISDLHVKVSKLNPPVAGPASLSSASL